MLVSHTMAEVLKQNRVQFKMFHLLKKDMPDILVIFVCKSFIQTLDTVAHF